MRALSLAAFLLPFLLSGTPHAASAQVTAETGTAAVWEGSLPRRPLPGEDIVITTPSDGAPRAAFRSPSASTPPPPPLPLATDLVKLARPLTFGNDGRCSVERADRGLLLSCAPGESISGLVLTFGPSRLPRGAALRLQVSAVGDVGFKAELTAEGAEAHGLLTLADGGVSLTLPMMSQAVPPQLVLLAPHGGGEMLLSRLELVPSAAPKQAGEASAWAWSPELWRSDPAGLVERAKARGIDRLFISLVIEGGEVRHAAELRRFVTLASAAGIAAEAVEGDPRMVLPEGQAAAIIRARAFAAYQRSAGAAERLSGIQYDVEPYVLPEWGETGPASYGGWGSTILALREAAGEPIDLVLPFWIANDEGGRGFLSRIAGAVRGVTSMSYRTDPPVLSQIAEPLLAWGAAAGKPVRLGLEAGPLPDETDEVFRRAETGTLALMAGEAPRLVRLGQPGKIEGAEMFERHHSYVNRASWLSFLGDEASMTGLVERISPAFAAWPSFSGFALHGLDWRSRAK